MSIKEIPARFTFRVRIGGHTCSVQADRAVAQDQGSNTWPSVMSLTTTSAAKISLVKSVSGMGLNHRAAGSKNRRASCTSSARSMTS
jgi:hypothetical protein